MEPTPDIFWSFIFVEFTYFFYIILKFMLLEYAKQLHMFWDIYI
jgi:hypothetical protein